MIFSCNHGMGTKVKQDKIVSPSVAASENLVTYILITTDNSCSIALLNILNSVYGLVSNLQLESNLQGI